MGARRIHGDSGVAERAAERSLSIDSHDGAEYVQFSHMYAAAQQLVCGRMLRK